MENMRADLASLATEVKYLKILIPSACGFVALVILVFWNIERNSIGERVSDALRDETVMETVTAIEVAEYEALAILGRLRKTEEVIQGNPLFELRQEVTKLQTENKKLQSRVKELESVNKPLIWQTLPLGNGWSNYGGTYSNFSYTKTLDGWVHLRGLIRGSKNQLPIAFLPEGFRPSTTEMFTSISDAGSSSIVARVDIEPNGRVLVHKNGGGWLTVSGITFYAGN